ncbi:DUF6124 family protein [Pseudomonas sp. McL0111]|uniref:DUF6124 family protein n=1 Tax=Pseudomonas sp. McL0111 TaxID=3457357 RepID=UPI00403E6747
MGRSPANQRSGLAARRSLDTQHSLFLWRKTCTIYLIVPNVDKEALFTNAPEFLASAKVIASDFAVFLDGPQRKTVLRSFDLAS